MEETHTPGPWSIGPMHGTVRPEGFERIGVSNNGCIICDVFGKDEKPANARLIAAATDMLAAIQRQVANIEHWQETGEAAGPDESREIYEQLKAAMSKARNMSYNA